MTSLVCPNVSRMIDGDGGAWLNLAHRPTHACVWYAAVSASTPSMSKISARMPRAARLSRVIIVGTITAADDPLAAGENATDENIAEGTQDRLSPAQERVELRARREVVPILITARGMADHANAASPERALQVDGERLA